MLLDWKKRKEQIQSSKKIRKKKNFMIQYQIENRRIKDTKHNLYTTRKKEIKNKHERIKKKVNITLKDRENRKKSKTNKQKLNITPQKQRITKPTTNKLKKKKTPVSNE